MDSRGQQKKILLFMRAWGIIHSANRKEDTHVKNKARWITETAIMLALLVVLQAVTKSAGQFVTGSCVNAVLAVTTLVAGLPSGLTVALVSPFVAFLFGIGPQLLPIVPAIALGNAVFVLMLSRLAGRNVKIWRQALALAGSAGAKFLTLYLVVVKLLCSILPLKPAQITTFSTMFTWPQLITALIGGAAALLIAPVIRKALHR